MTAFIGTAGWALPADERSHFGEGASNLARYATRFNCVEINSSFYRRHRPSTWTRWGESVPEDFRFSVKLPKLITHIQRLKDCDDLIDEFAGDTHGLGSKFAVTLVQLAPKHVFDPALARTFFAQLHSRVGAQTVCEPRHPSWFSPDADEVLATSGVARVASDPAIVPLASTPGGSPKVHYWRLHGSPVVYRSSYDFDAICHYASEIKASMREAGTWCIFDNTASSAATANARQLHAALSR